ncbi:MAG: lysophospholipid acyltransferase family protein [Qingshengfaniella sp.]
MRWKSWSLTGLAKICRPSGGGWRDGEWGGVVKTADISTESPTVYVPYDKRKLSYATTFDNPLTARTIRAMEWATGKITLLRLIRRFERLGVPEGQAFWDRALAVMGIRIDTPAAQIRHIPREGPLVVVANHPHGLVDGMVLAALIGQVRVDYRILTRSLLTGVAEVSRFMIPVPFPHEAEALAKNLDMRRRAMAHLADGGAIVLFPSGVVASAKTLLGPAREADWNPFTAKLIQRSGATVLPVYFPGQNSRAYQIAAQHSAVLRQGLLLHEVVHALNQPQKPVIGAPILPPDIRQWEGNPRGFMAWLRGRTLALGQDPIGT